MYGNASLLRIATAGSVDDGKSTLIGRLLLDSKAIFEDQLKAIEMTSASKGFDYTDLALITDGLRSEREQGITIDVAYRYFSTPTRKFILADTPGHLQYTRNMVTAATTADLGLFLVDARRGLTGQSRRHAVLLSLLRVPHLVIAINKMDLVDFSEKAFNAVARDFAVFIAALKFSSITIVPISALEGDNVVDRSDSMPWYSGPCLMHLLESLQTPDGNTREFRLPIQSAIRARSQEFADFRGYTGQIAGGFLKPGDPIMVLPSGFTSTIESIEVSGVSLPYAFSPMSVMLSIKDDLDVSRGDMVCHPVNPPHVSNSIEAMVFWMSTNKLYSGQSLLIKHTTKISRALIQSIRYRLDTDNLERQEEASFLDLNDIGHLLLRTADPLLFDYYSHNRTTGSFILIDELTYETVAGGVIVAPD